MTDGDIGRLHRAYLEGSLSPLEVAEAHLGRAERENGRLNAFSRLLRERALAEARASAARYGRGAPRSRLDGVPVSVKDLMHVAGAPTRAASAAAPAGDEAEDADVVARLSALGAVVFAKTNLLEYAYGVVHPAFGAAHNPWQPARSAGGSSSGAAVAVASGIGLAAIGTDTCGSVRNPAAWCGTVGFKPTRHALPVGGVVPLAPTLDHVGILTRTVADTRVVFTALTGAADPDPGPTHAKRALRVGVARLPGASTAVQARCDEALRRLAEDGAELTEVDPLPWTVANAAALALVYAEALEVHAERLPALWHGYSQAMRLRLLAGGAVTSADYVRARSVRHALRQAWAPTLAAAGVDLIALPTMPTGAPREAELRVAGGDLAAATLYTSAFSLLGVPAITVPVGLDDANMPVGLQLAGVAGADLQVLEAAARLEAVVPAFPSAPDTPCVPA